MFDRKNNAEEQEASLGTISFKSVQEDLPLREGKPPSDLYEPGLWCSERQVQSLFEQGEEGRYEAKENRHEEINSSKLETVLQIPSLKHLSVRGTEGAQKEANLSRRKEEDEEEEKTASRAPSFNCPDASPIK